MSWFLNSFASKPRNRNRTFGNINDNLGRKSINIHIPFDKNHQTGLTKCAEARNNIIPYEAEDDINVVLLYLSKRPSPCDTADLFLKPSENIQQVKFGFWFLDRPASKEAVTTFVQQAVKKIGLSPNEGSGFTGHSIRATQITKLARKGVQDSDLMIYSGHKSAASLKAYKRNPEKKVEIMQLLNSPKLIPKRKIPEIVVNLSANLPFKPPKMVNLSANLPFKPPKMRKIQ